MAQSAFYTIKEAAAILGVSRTTIYGYTRKRGHKNALPIRRFGRNCIRIPKEQFHKWAGLAEGAQ